MIMIRYVCDRCGASWEEEPNIDKPHNKYTVAEYILSTGKKFGKYANKTLCPDCISALDVFLKGEKV